MIRRLTTRFARCEKGVAALEFGLIAPFLIILLLGGFEVSRFLIVQQKTEKVAFTVADVAAQYDPDEGINIDQVFAAVEEIMKPYPFGSEGLVVLSSVTREDTDQGPQSPKVRWQCVSNGGLEATSTVGVVDGDASLPQNFSLDDGDNVVVAEVFFRFSPVFDTTFTAPFVIHRTALFRPRLGALTSVQC